MMTSCLRVVSGLIVRQASFVDFSLAVRVDSLVVTPFNRPLVQTDAFFADVETVFVAELFTSLSVTYTSKRAVTSCRS